MLPAHDPHEETRKLVESAQAGDARARETLAARTYAGVLAAARTFLRGRFKPLRGRLETRDLAQSAYVDALRSLPAFKPTATGSFRGWLLGILRNKLRRRVASLTALRRDARREAPLPAVPASAESPSRRTLQAEERARLERALADLPSSHGAVVRLRFYDELSWDEIAARLGTSPEAAQMRCTRALRLLRTTYEKMV